MEQKVFYVPGRHGIIDLAIQRPDGVLVGEFSKETLEQIGRRYPGAQLGDFDTVLDAQEQAMKTDPKEVTEEHFIEMLECLPPMGYVNCGNTESFKVCELVSGNIANIYARIGSRYFHLCDVASIKHDAIIAKINRRFH